MTESHRVVAEPPASASLSAPAAAGAVGTVTAACTRLAGTGRHSGEVGEPPAPTSAGEVGTQELVRVRTCIRVTRLGRAHCQLSEADPTSLGGLGGGRSVRALPGRTQGQSGPDSDDRAEPQAGRPAARCLQPGWLVRLRRPARIESDSRRGRHPRCSRQAAAAQLSGAAVRQAAVVRVRYILPGIHMSYSFNSTLAGLVSQARQRSQSVRPSGLIVRVRSGPARVGASTLLQQPR